jgi:hypothetical protein
MYTKTVEYENYNGEKVKKKLYFSLNKAELLEMEMRSEGGYDNYLKRIINTRDQNELTSIFKTLILKSYGIKSDDGERFIKNDKIREEFEQSAAYAELFVELATNAQSATDFANGIIPAALYAEVQKEMNNKGISSTKEYAEKLLQDEE